MKTRPHALPDCIQLPTHSVERFAVAVVRTNGAECEVLPELYPTREAVGVNLER